MVGIVILSVSLIILAMVFVIKWHVESSRKKETSDWQVGDLLCISGEDDYVTLVGWSNESFYIDLKNVVHKIGWRKLKYNKSAVWRRNHKSCEEYMGTQPGFKPALKNEVSTKSKINDKPIELLTETECQIYLKKALEEENYELADAIRKQMEKYR